MSNLDIASLPPGGTTPSFGPPPGVRDNVRPPEVMSEPDKAAAKDERGFFDRMWGKEGFSFGALLDIVNPLQHIPIVGTVYRAITGDSIGPASRIAGGTLFGGVVGLVASTIDSLVQEETGRDFGQHILAMRGDADKAADPTTPTGRPEREPVLYAGDFSPRPDPTTMLADASAKAGPKADVVIALETTAAPAVVAQAAPQATATQQPRAAIAAPAAANGRAFPVSAPVHEAANGAGGSAIPLATTVNRRQPVPLPTPQSLAGDPAALRQMQTTRVSAQPQNQPQNQPRNASSIDTTIRPAANAAGVSPTFLDYTPKNAALRNVDSGASNDKATADVPAPQTQKIDAGSFPQVPADLISRMNSALEKYQSMQRVTERPAVNVSQ